MGCFNDADWQTDRDRSPAWRQQQTGDLLGVNYRSRVDADGWKTVEKKARLGAMLMMTKTGSAHVWLGCAALAQIPLGASESELHGLNVAVT